MGSKSTCSHPSTASKEASWPDGPDSFTLGSPHMYGGLLPHCCQHPYSRFLEECPPHEQLDSSLRRGLCRQNLPPSPREMSDKRGRQEAELDGRGKVGRRKDGGNISPMGGWDTWCPEQATRIRVQGHHSIIPSTDAALTTRKIQEVLSIQKHTTPRP